MNGKELDGRVITCNNACQMVERPEGEQAVEAPCQAPGVCASAEIRAASPQR